MRYPAIPRFSTLLVAVALQSAAPIRALAQSAPPTTLMQVHGEVARHAELTRLSHDDTLNIASKFRSSPAYPDYLRLRSELATCTDRRDRAEDEVKLNELVLEQLKKQIEHLTGRLSDMVQQNPELMQLQRLAQQADELSAREQALSRAMRRTELLLTGLGSLYSSIDELLKGKKDLDARIAEKEKDLPGQVGDVRLRNATYLANARKASTDMGVKIKELQAGREKVVVELRRLGGAENIEQAVENVRREHGAIVELFNDAHWFVGEAAFQAKAHTTIPTRATVSSVEGAVVIRHRNGAKSKPSLDTTFRDGDVIATGRDGRVEFYLPDGSQLKIGSNSEFTLGVESQLKGGWFRFREDLQKGVGVSEALDRTREQMRQRNRYSTRDAILAVRGTDFIMQADDERTRVFVRTGEVEVTSVRGRDHGKSTRVPARQQVTVDAAAGGITPPTPISEAEFRRLTWNASR